jgi:hypothetical protein
MVLNLYLLANFEQGCFRIMKVFVNEPTNYQFYSYLTTAQIAQFHLSLV